MAKKHQRRNSPPFVKLEKRLLHHPSYKSLSHAAVRLLVDLLEQYNGNNNGDLTDAWTVMQKRGWTSKSGKDKARNELLKKGFLIPTRQGGRHQCSLYAVSFHPLDDCPGKNLDRTPKGQERTRPPDYWKSGYNPEIGFPAPNEGQPTPNKGQYSPERKAS